MGNKRRKKLTKHQRAEYIKASVRKMNEAKLFYKSSKLLEGHQKKLHYKNATHKCTKCDKACLSFEELKIHFLHTHTNWKKTDSPEREISNAESSADKELTSSETKTTDCTDFLQDKLSSTVTKTENANTTEYSDVLNNEKSIPSNAQSSGTVLGQLDTSTLNETNVSIVKCE